MNEEFHDDKCTSNFENDFGIIATKEIICLKIAHVLHECLPLIDEHNMQRQSLWNAERKWHAKDFWFALLKTMTRVCVIDMHRWLISAKSKRSGIDHHYSLSNKLDGCYDIVVRKFSNILCSRLSNNERMQCDQRQNEKYYLLHKVSARARPNLYPLEAHSIQNACDNVINLLLATNEWIITTFLIFDLRLEVIVIKTKLLKCYLNK